MEILWSLIFNYAHVPQFHFKIPASSAAELHSKLESLSAVNFASAQASAALAQALTINSVSFMHLFLIQSCHHYNMDVREQARGKQP